MHQLPGLLGWRLSSARRAFSSSTVLSASFPDLQGAQPHDAIHPFVRRETTKILYLHCRARMSFSARLVAFAKAEVTTADVEIESPQATILLSGPYSLLRFLPLPLQWMVRLARLHGDQVSVLCFVGGKMDVNTAFARVFGGVVCWGRVFAVRCLLEGC